jgi:bifunctional DNase/RNase
MWLEMKVKGLALDPLSNMPMIILRDEEEKRSLPIWVGLFEANAIALELEKISTPRPMTHDLIKNILESLDARVQKIVVNDPATIPSTRSSISAWATPTSRWTRGRRTRLPSLCE